MCWKSHVIYWVLYWKWCFPGDASGKEPACQWRNIKDTGSIPGWGRSPGGGHGSPLQYSCLENPMDRGVRWATVQSVTKSQTQQQRLSTHTLKVKTRMVVWVQNECKCVGCLRSWFQGWPGAQLTAAAQSHPEWSSHSGIYATCC